MLNVSKIYCGVSGDSDHLRYGKSDGKPILVFNCTRRCNLKCRHCYSNSGITTSCDELSTSEAKLLIDDIAAFGCPVLLFSGGEPLLRQDLLDLLEYSKAKGLRTALSTNGTLIDEKTAKNLASAQVAYAGISLDGDKQFHDDFRGQSECYEEALNGIENCHRYGIKTGLRFTITKLNLKFTASIFEIAANSGVRRICFYHLIRTGRAADMSDDSPTPDQTRQVLDVIFEKTQHYVGLGLIDEVLTVGNHADGPYLLVTMIREGKNIKTALELLRRNRGNRIGEMIACVNWDGKVFADQFWRNYSLGNIKQRPFSKIWLDTSEPVLAKLRSKINLAAHECASCEWFDVCQGNYRFTGVETGESNWFNEPACYLTKDEKISKGDK